MTSGPARLTGQVTTKDRVTFSREQQQRCEGSTLTTAGEGCRQRAADWVALGSNTFSPEAHLGYFDLPYCGDAGARGRIR